MGNSRRLATATDPEGRGPFRAKLEESLDRQLVDIISACLDIESRSRPRVQFLNLPPCSSSVRQRFQQGPVAAVSLQLSVVGLSPTPTPRWRACLVDGADGGCTNGGGCYDGGPQASSRPRLTPTRAAGPAPSPLGIFTAVTPYSCDGHDGGIPTAARYSSSTAEALEWLLPPRPYTGGPFGAPLCAGGGAMASGGRDCWRAAPVAAAQRLTAADEWQPKGVLEFLRDVGLNGASLRSPLPEATATATAAARQWPPHQLAVAMAMADEEGPLALSIRRLPSPQPLCSNVAGVAPLCLATEHRTGAAELRARSTALGHAAIAGLLSQSQQPKGRCSGAWPGIGWRSRNPAWRPQLRSTMPEPHSAAQRGACGAVSAAMATATASCDGEGARGLGDSAAHVSSSSSSPSLMNLYDIVDASAVPVIRRLQPPPPPPHLQPRPQLAAAAPATPNLIEATEVRATHVLYMPYAAPGRARRGAAEAVMSTALSLLGTGADPTATGCCGTVSHHRGPALRSTSRTLPGMYGTATYDSRASVVVTRDTPVPSVSGGTLRTLWVAAGAAATRDLAVIFIPPDDEASVPHAVPALHAWPREQDAIGLGTALLRLQSPSDGMPVLRGADPFPDPAVAAAYAVVKPTSAAGVADAGTGAEAGAPGEQRDAAGSGPGLTRRVIDGFRALRHSGKKGLCASGGAARPVGTCSHRELVRGCGSGCGGTTTGHADGGGGGGAAHSGSRERKEAASGKLNSALKTLRRRLAALKDRAVPSR